MVKPCIKWFMVLFCVFTQPRENAAEVFWGEPVEGVRLGLEPLTNVIAASEGPQDFLVHLQNNGERSIIYEAFPYRKFYEFVALDEQGSRIPQPPTEPWPFGARPDQLAPGQTRSFNMYLGHFLVITNSGAYTLFVQRWRFFGNAPDKVLVSGGAPIRVWSTNDLQREIGASISTNEQAPGEPRMIDRQELVEAGRPSAAPLRAFKGTSNAEPSTIRQPIEQPAERKPTSTRLVGGAIISLISLIGLILIRARRRQRR